MYSDSESDSLLMLQWKLHGVDDGREQWPGPAGGAGGRHLQAQGQEGSTEEEEYLWSQRSQVYSKILQTSNFLLSLQGFYMVSNIHFIWLVT